MVRLYWTRFPREGRRRWIPIILVALALFQSVFSRMWRIRRCSDVQYSSGLSESFSSIAVLNSSAGRWSNGYGYAAGVFSFSRFCCLCRSLAIFCSVMGGFRTSLRAVGSGSLGGAACLPAPAEHRQLPTPIGQRVAQYIYAVVVAADLAVTVFRAVPLVEVLNHLDSPLFQIKSQGALLAAISGMAFHPYGQRFCISFPVHVSATSRLFFKVSDSIYMTSAFL